MTRPLELSLLETEILLLLKELYAARSNLPGSGKTPSRRVINGKIDIARRVLLMAESMEIKKT